MQGPTDLSLVASISIPLISGMFMGALFHPDRVLFTPKLFYQKLIVSPYTPNYNVFPIIWTVFYTLLGVAYFKIQTVSNTTPDADLKHLTLCAMDLYWVLLGSVLLFKPTIFGLKNLTLALAILVIVSCLLAGLIGITNYIDVGIALLLVPNLLWTIYATYLQYFIWLNNTGGSETEPILQ